MRRLPLLASTALVLLAVRILVYAVWFEWSAYWAWGPRYLVPAMPVLAVGLIEVCRRWSGLRLVVKAALGVVLGVSGLVQVVGATVGYEHAVMFSALLRAHPPVLGPGFVVDESLPSTQAVFDRVLFDWSLWPIPDEARDLVQGRYLSSHWLAPTPNLTVIAALLICGALAGAVAVAAARWSDGRAKAAPGETPRRSPDKAHPVTSSRPPTLRSSRSGRVDRSFSDSWANEAAKTPSAIGRAARRMFRPAGVTRWSIRRPRPARRRISSWAASRVARGPDD